ncbi:MAG: superoxide dismutase [Kiritimatiellae bacterium]|nr:superoxide dismutase [Kiritimatiellia bacterium]
MSEIALKELPYGMDALEPAISRRTLEFHYGKHHAGYVKTLNGLIAGTPYADMELADIVKAAAAKGDAGVFNQAAQSWNHAFYWESLAPAGTGGAPEGPLADAIAAKWGGVEACASALAEAAVKRFGSGWAWLVKDADGSVRVESTSNAETPLTKEGATPLLVIDVWEHAYYLDWQNRRADYAKELAANLLNWKKANERWA